MSDESDLPVEDALALSRLDVISCALGAAVLLGLILSVIRVSAPVTITSDRYIDLLIDVTFTSPESRPTLGVVLKGPGLLSPVWLPIDAFDPCSGAIQENPTDPELLSLLPMGWPTLGGAAIGIDCLDLAGTDSNRSGHLRIDAAAPGIWTIGLYLRTAANPLEIGTADSVPQATIVGELHTRTSRRPEAIFEHLPAGEVRWLTPIKVSE